MNILLKLFSSADETITVRARAGQQIQQEISQPSLTMHASAVPKRFFDSLAPKLLSNGFFPRLLIVEGGFRGKARTPAPAELPASLLAIGKYWRDFVPNKHLGNMVDQNPRPQLIKTTAEAARIFDELQSEIDDRYGQAETRDDQPAMAILGRCVEQGRRLALCYACSANHQAPTINKDAAAWASKFIKHQCQLGLYRASASISETPFEEKCQRALGVLRAWKATNGDEFMAAWRIARKLRSWTNREHEEVRNALLSQGRIEQGPITHDGAGRPGIGFRIH